MRDILLTAIVFGSIPFILRWPHIGVLMWVWLSVMNPHRLTWGFAYGFNFAAIIAAVTLVSAVVSKDLRRPPATSLVIALIFFSAWTGVTTLFALYPAAAYERWVTLMKTELIVLLIPMLFHTKERVRLFIWVLVLSIAYYGVKGGVWALLTGGGERVYGPEGSYLEDNNALAVAIIMMIPLMRFLQLTSPSKHVRWGLVWMMLFCGVGALGSYSRGAFLAVATMVAFLCWKSKHKLPVVLVAIVAIPAALSFMPEKWYKRMDTIATYEQDSSANMRLNAWGTMFNLAKDRPLVGGGFEVAEKAVYDRYAPDPTYPPQAAHSIYFQALGEHGFVGLGLLLWLYVAFWRHAGALVRLTEKRPDLAWMHYLGRMMQVSFMGFAVGGAFLSFVNVDLTYYLVGTLVAVRSLLDKELRATGAAAKGYPFRRVNGVAVTQSTEAGGR
jgi:putative inorganic carbon (hco3(-)) transporter